MLRLTAGMLLQECQFSLKKAIEVAGNKKLLSIVAQNKYGVSALITQHGDDPEFAKAILKNSEILHEYANETSIRMVMETYKKAFVDGKGFSPN